MAYLWNVLREEISGTIDDFREKGAWGAFKDATLDAVDLVQDAGGALVNGTAQLLSLERPLLCIGAHGRVPESGDEVQISLSNGQPPVMAKVYGVDSISDPPRARVIRMDTCEEVLVDIVRASDMKPQQPVSWVVDEVGRAVVEVREKGPGVLKDGVLDTMDIVKEGASVAMTGAHRCIATLRGDAPSAEPLAPCNPSLEQMYGDQSGQHPTKLPSLAPIKMPVEPTPILLSPRDDDAQGDQRVAEGRLEGRLDADDWYNDAEIAEEEVID